MSARTLSRNVAGLPAHGADNQSQLIELSVAGMTCASCVRHVENALSAVQGVESASVNLATERAQVRVPAGLDSTLLTQAVVHAGYEAQVVSNPQQSSNTEAARREADRLALRRDLLLAALLALPVFILEMGAHLIPGFHHFVAETIGTQNSWYLQFILTTAVLAGPGRRFFAKGIPALLRLTPDMNSLVAVGTTAAYLYSVVATFVSVWLPVGTVNVYYEAAAVIVALVLLGRYLEARAKGNTSEAIKRLQVGDKVQLGFVDPEIQGEFLPVVITVIQPDGLQGRLAAAPKRLPYLRADQVVSFDWVNILKIFA